MRFEQRLRHQPSRIRNSPHPYSSVIVGDVLDQPIDGVISVCALIDGFGVAVVAHRSLHDKLTFRLEPSANVLEDENVAVGNQFFIAPRVEPLLILRYPVWCSQQENRKDGALL